MGSIKFREQGGILLVDDTGYVYASGVFNDSQNQIYLAKWDGKIWAAFGIGSNDSIIHHNSFGSGPVFFLGSNNSFYLSSNGFVNAKGFAFIIKWNGKTWENNVYIMLEAFSQLPSKKLVFVGDWNSSSYGREMKDIYNFFPNILMLDTIYDQHSLDLLRSNSSIYIHGHRIGRTNPSLVEAMYLGLPVIAYRVSYNVVTTGNKALYFNRVKDLV
jgi:glycosyltransferase involved in cell wall biosynthesis